jgi:hypothetical protein
MPLKFLAVPGQSSHDMLLERRGILPNNGLRILRINLSLTEQNGFIGNTGIAKIKRPAFKSAALFLRNLTG